MTTVPVSKLVNCINHSHQAIQHTLKQIRDNPSVGYHLGEFTETFSQLVSCDRELSLLGSNIPTIEQATIEQFRQNWRPISPAAPEIDMNKVNEIVAVNTQEALENMDTAYRDRVIDLLERFPRFQGIAWGAIELDRLLDQLEIAIDDQTATLIRAQKSA